MDSPLLSAPGAVPGEAPDAGVAAHYGNPYAEQRALAAGTGMTDRSHRGVVRITGPDRLSWLHSLTTQDLEHLEPGQSAEALILSPQGHIEHHLTLTDDGDALWAHVEPGTAGTLLAFLESMRFMLRVEPADVTDDYAVLTVTRALPADSLPEGAAAALHGAVGTTCSSRVPSSSRRNESLTPGSPWPGCRPTRRSGSRPGARGWDWTLTTGPCPTRSAGSSPPCT